MPNTDTQRTKRYTPGVLALSEAKAQADRIESLLASTQRSGGDGLTVREVCREYERVYGDVLFPNHAEARLSNLEAAGRVLVDRLNPRACSVTGVKVKVCRVPLQQVPLI